MAAKSFVGLYVMRHLAKIMAVRVEARRSLIALPAAVLLLTMSGLTAQAASVLFDFNSSSLYSTYTTLQAPSNTDNSAAVQTYMNGVLGAAGTVAVTGATSAGSPTNAGYAGEGHVVCTSGGSGSACTPDTLATVYSTPFLMTNSSAPYNGDNSINMAFTGGIKVSSVSFAFEIFPDASGQTPDFTFTLLNGSTPVEDCSVSAVSPGTALTTTAPACATGSISSFSGGPSGSTNVHSPLSLSATELSKQYLGTMTLTFASVTNPTLHFQDWPDTIGITKVTLGLTPPTTVPEPSSLAMLASGLIGIGIARRRRRQSA